jgi:hypothetical protein
MGRLSTGIAIAVFALVAAASPARASFHNWDINEVFSNVDGTLQYIEFFTNGNFEVLVGGRPVVTRMNTVTLQTYVIPMNLPPNTAMKFFLIGTQDVPANLGVTPDYIMPDGFLDVGLLDEIDFVAADVMLIGSALGDEGEIPTDGFNSLNQGMGVLPATPTNFAGVVPEPGAGLASFAALGTIIALSRTGPRRRR